MALTDAQLSTWKTHIFANTDPAIIAARTAGQQNTRVIADWYNAASTFWVFRRLVGRREMSEAIELDDVGNMTAGDVEKLNVFFNLRPEGFFAELASERAGFDDILSGANADDSQQRVIAVWTRNATELEKIFANTAGGDGSTAALAALLVFKGNVSISDVAKAFTAA